MSRALAVVVVVACVAFIAALFIEWAAGCGESYMDSEGEWHAFECVFLR